MCGGEFDCSIQVVLLHFYLKLYVIKIKVKTCRYVPIHLLVKNTYSKFEFVIISLEASAVRRKLYKEKPLLWKSGRL